MPNQFYTFCKRCKRQILMTQDNVTHKWSPCDPEIFTFIEDDSVPDTFVSAEDGAVKHGLPSDKYFAERGYSRHRRDCDR